MGNATSCHAGRQEVSRCRVSDGFEESHSVQLGNHVSEGSTLALKPRTDVSISPKTGVSLAPQKGPIDVLKSTLSRLFCQRSILQGVSPVKAPLKSVSIHIWLYLAIPCLPCMGKSRPPIYGYVMNLDGIFFTSSLMNFSTISVFPTKSTFPL